MTDTQVISAALLGLVLGLVVLPWLAFEGAYWVSQRSLWRRWKGGHWERVYVDWPVASEMWFQQPHGSACPWEHLLACEDRP